jgi:EAL domain-containing protein (putative c-di-GMP-specific phosphodiesterase class I)
MGHPTRCGASRQDSQFGICRFRVSINLFDSQLRNEGLTSIVTTALEEHALPADALELEITENVFLQPDEVMIRPLRRLRELGVGVAFDDYGTGYASLSLLKGFPLSRLKIDILPIVSAWT